MRAPHLATGDWGEDLAAAWYREHGYTVLDRNWRGASGEIDLVATRDRLVVIVEVKPRRSDKYGAAATAVDLTKQRRLRGLAVEWLRAREVHGVHFRFDVVAITGPDLRIIHAAF